MSETNPTLEGDDFAQGAMANGQAAVKVLS